MEGIKIVAVVFILSGFKFCIVDGDNCKKELKNSGIIYSNGSFVPRKICWIIPVPSGSYVRLKLIQLLSKKSCKDLYIAISSTKASDTQTFCGMLQKDKHKKSPIYASGDVKVTYFAVYIKEHTIFELEYNIVNKECLNQNSFQCDNNTCIPRSQLCDGMRDCRNGADEKACGSRIPSMEGVKEARENAISWLKRKKTLLWGWGENTSRAITALYLSSAAEFNGSSLQEELTAQQNQVRSVVALLRSSLKISELSVIVNSLLTTCHNPRNFYGYNLVKLLKTKVEESRNVTHPLAFLALCNANEPWPSKANSDLNKILNSSPEYTSRKDLQAIALMALSCIRKRGYGGAFSTSTSSLFKKTIQYLKQLQAPDGSFGNVQTTALITQALLSSGQEHQKDWKQKEAIQYLMNKLKSSSADFLATYLTLPILNGKSLVDISKINCTANSRNKGNGENILSISSLGSDLRG